MDTWVSGMWFERRLHLSRWTFSSSPSSDIWFEYYNLWLSLPQRLSLEALIRPWNLYLVCHTLRGSSLSKLYNCYLYGFIWACRWLLATHGRIHLSFDNPGHQAIQKENLLWELPRPQLLARLSSIRHCDPFKLGASTIIQLSRRCRLHQSLLLLADLLSHSAEPTAADRSLRSKRHWWR